MLIPVRTMTEGKNPEAAQGTQTGKEAARGGLKAKGSLKNASEFAALLKQFRTGSPGGAEGEKLSFKQLLSELKQILLRQAWKKGESSLPEQLRSLLTKQGNIKTNSEWQPFLDKLKNLLTSLKDNEKSIPGELKKILDEWEKKIPASELLPQQPPRNSGNESIPLPENKEFSPPGDKKKQEQTPAPKIVVLDLRRSQASHETKLSRQKEQSIIKAETAPQDKVESLSSREIRYLAPGGGDQHTSHEQPAFREIFKEAARNMPASDAAKLKDALKGEVVRQTGIVLKNSDRGEIRLILKPEALGRVRINMNLNNNHIDGRIMVENNIVREAFEASLESLNASLKEQGFDSVSLQVAVGDHYNGRRENPQQEKLKPWDEVSREFEKQIPQMAEYRDLDALVNLVV